MDNLRILMMILGIVVIVGIYLWGTGFDHRKAARRVSPKSQKTPQSAKTEPVLDTPVIKPREEDAIEFSGSISHKEPETDAANLDHTPSNYAEDKEPDVIVLFVTAPGGYNFNGGVIRDALYEAGFSYGEMNIFHHFGVGTSRSQNKIISVANIHEPGTLLLNNIEALRTDGLVFFMQLPSPIDAAIAFELLLSTTQRVAEILKGHVRDDQHEYLSAQKIETLRQRVAAYPTVQ